MSTLFDAQFYQEALKERNSKKSSWPKNLSGLPQIDSRKIQPGDCYIALKGEHQDGHDFVQSALEKGASFAIVENSYLSTRPSDLLIVDSTQQALFDIAHTHLERLPAKRIAITGSAGKTTTKEMCRAIFEHLLGKDKVLAATGTFNNHFGVPLTAFEAKAEHEVCIFELGMNHPGEIKALSQTVSPDFGCITNIGLSHVGNFENEQGIMNAKAEIYAGFNSDSLALVNLDDPACVQGFKQSPHKEMLGYGKNEASELRLLKVEDPLKCTFTYGNQTYSVKLQGLGIHNAQNASAALAIAVAYGLDFRKSCLALEHFKPATGRMNSHHLRDDIILLDDTYNASYEAMQSAIETLALLKSQYKIAVLGPMGEQGSQSEKLHRSIGALCNSSGLQALYLFGKESIEYINGALDAGFDPKSIHHFRDKSALFESLFGNVKPNMAILVKGSRAYKMETIANELIAKLKA